jgi:hypothetical protein
LADPFEVVVVEEEEEEGHAVSESDMRLYDRVHDRVNRMLSSVKRDLDVADGAIGVKLKVLDTDNDGRIGLEELTGVGGILAEQLNPEDVEELRGILGGLAVDCQGRVDVSDLSALVSDLIAKEFMDYEGDYDGVEEEEKVGSTQSRGPCHPPKSVMLATLSTLFQTLLSWEYDITTEKQLITACPWEKVRSGAAIAAVMSESDEMLKEVMGKAGDDAAAAAKKKAAHDI